VPVAHALGEIGYSQHRQRHDDGADQAVLQQIRVQQEKQDAADHEQDMRAVRNDHRVVVHKAGVDADGDEDEIDQRVPGESEPVQDQHIEDAGQRLHQRIAGGDGLAAVAAPASQKQPAEDGNQIVPGQLVMAGHAVGTAPGNRFAVLIADDADVQKGADHGSQNEYIQIDPEEFHEDIMTRKRIL